MSRSNRGNEADGLRRSSRQRRQKYGSLNQSFLIEPSEILAIADRANRKAVSTGGKDHGSTSRGKQSITPNQSRSKHRSVSERRVSPREMQSLRRNMVEHSDSEEVLDIYSRVKRRRRCSQPYVLVEPLEPQHEDSNPSIVTEGDSDFVQPDRKRQRNGFVESSDEHSMEEEDETIRQRYSLRPTRSIPQRFEAALPVPPKRMHKSGENEDGGSDTHGPRRSAFHSPAHRRANRQHYLLEKKASDSSSDSEISDTEAKFERKQTKKMERSRGRFLPFNLAKNDVQRAVGKNVGRPRVGASCADVDPMHIDSSIGFESVGGLIQHIYSLKEMILFPLTYPEYFARFKISPPRGVLFYGPPGTGKTLVARALANECSKGDRKVAFFMRKGADCLSKWVGESERQLRLLFDQAYSMRPSIIFFDEIDGLAPVRSSRQDQIHSSIVSTLLALMDGLDERGEVIVIGATNRLDSIDPALRRPGRFDRELRFTMPDKEARKEILRIQTKAWEPPLADDLLVRLAARTVGYGGADLKGLCTESALIALRKSFPQIYTKEHRLALDPASIQVKEDDFIHAMEKQTPCSERSLTAPVRAVADFMQPLIGSMLQEALNLVPTEFVKLETDEKQDINDVQTVLSTFTKRPPILGRRVLLCGQNAECGQTKYFAPALLHAVDHLPIHSLAISNLYATTNRSPEEFIAETLTMASRGGPCVLFIPSIDSWDSIVSPTAWATLKSCLDNWTAKIPVLIVATAHAASTELDEKITTLFGGDGIVEVGTEYSKGQRRAFFEPLLTAEAQKPPPEQMQGQYNELPLAPPPPPRKFTEAELKAFRREEEAVFRQLRIFLREIAMRLFRDRKFVAFTKPVDLEEAPDYYDIVESPMDLSKMLRKIDQHKYECVEEFLADIDLIRANALEYNPDNDQSDKVIRHRACDLRDVAYELIETELDPEFEEKCKNIKKARSERGENGPTEPPPDYLFTARTKAEALAAEALNNPNGAETIGASSATAAANKVKVKAAAIIKKYRKNHTRRRLFNLKHRKGKKAPLDGTPLEIEEDQMEQDANSESKQPNGEEVETETGDEAKTENDEDSAAEEPIELPEPPKLELSMEDMDMLLSDVIKKTREYSLVMLERTYVEIEAVVLRYANSWDRKSMPDDIRKALRM